jgi:hypothetical protein
LNILSLRAASQTLLLGAVVAIPVGLLNLFFPPVLDKTVWGHPFDPRTHVAVSIVLVFAHLLKAHGFAVGLARLDGAGRVVRWSMWAAALGFVVVAICEGISATLAGVPMDSPPAVQLNNGYGAGSMLLAVASMVGGTVIARERLLEGPARWSVLLSGAFMIFVVTPALMMGRAWPAYLALTAWSVFFVWIGRALGRTVRG